MSKIYCGVGDVPEDKIRGTAEQCVGKNQVRYYGLKKISKSALDTVKLGDLMQEEMKLRKLIWAIQGTEKRYKQEKNSKNSDKKKLKRLADRYRKKAEEYKKQKVRVERARKIEKKTEKLLKKKKKLKKEIKKLIKEMEKRTKKGKSITAIKERIKKRQKKYSAM